MEKPRWGTIEEVVNSAKLTWLYDAPIEVVNLEQNLFVLHKGTGVNIHALDHFRCK